MLKIVEVFLSKQRKLFCNVNYVISELQNHAFNNFTVTI
jgi:hypothetical protein